MAEYSVSELRSLRSALKRLLASEAKILKAMSKGDDTIKTEAKYQEIVSKKRETLNSLGEADYLRSKSKTGSRGGGGAGAPLDLSQGQMRRITGKEMKRKKIF